MAEKWNLVKVDEGGYYGLNYVPPNSYVEVLTLIPQNVTVFVYRVFKEVTKFK